ncbi:hypothetical protein L2729_16980 [Shewanella gelidimarina]|uniref:hypothetical protein n=1 Tax=Shewanella gelidimarina TaxID=56813 RepID=UPI00200CFE0B|nr:hypothetical protein [Shewanella gelidimarina]MCL1059666.1 hypothetical protein [Shewanella gelidimarina]
MLERMYFCTNLIDTAEQAIEKGEPEQATANLQALRNLINGLKFGDESTLKVINKVAEATGVDDLQTLERLILAGCTVAARGHGSSKQTFAELLKREAGIAKVVTLPMLGVR